MKILIIQTAFIGDVILATPLPKVLKKKFHESQIHFLVRAGNEILLKNNPNIGKVWIWNKKKNKHLNLIKLIAGLRKIKFDLIVNPHRFFSSGLITALVPAKEKIGFEKNPLSFLYTRKYPHIFDGRHEVERNLSLIKDYVNTTLETPELFPSANDYEKIKDFTSDIVIAPASEWQTKQYPPEKWIDLIAKLQDFSVALIGADKDFELCEKIAGNFSNVLNLCGKLNLLESAALIDKAKVLISNDSAPVHIASAMNTPTVEIYCSTIPEFGFFPLAENSVVIQTSEKLSCRPCGLHGKKECPLKHFKCAYSIDNNIISEKIKNLIYEKAP